MICHKHSSSCRRRSTITASRVTRLDGKGSDARPSSCTNSRTRSTCFSLHCNASAGGVRYGALLSIHVPVPNGSRPSRADRKSASKTSERFSRKTDCNSRCFHRFAYSGIKILFHCSSRIGANSQATRPISLPYCNSAPYPLTSRGCV